MDDLVWFASESEDHIRASTSRISMLQDVHKFITTTLRAFPADACEKQRLTEGLRQLLYQYDVVELMSAAMAEDLGRDMAARSYHHPNGFTKVVLIPFSVHHTPFELRVHDWQTVDDASTDLPNFLSGESIHDHGWNFASYIARGALAFQEFAPSEKGELYDQYEYVRPDESITFIRRHIGQARLACIRDGVYRYPDLYYFSRDGLHRSLPLPGQRTISILLQGPAVANRGRIFRHPNLPASRVPPPQRPLAEEELRQILTSIRDALSNLSPAMET